MIEKGLDNIINIDTIISGAKALKNRHFFKEAYTLLEDISLDSIDSDKKKDDIIHTMAQCKYQDKEISSKRRFNLAEEVLDKSSNEDEKNRLKGAIYKRKYQLEKNIGDLYKAIKYYEKTSKNYIEDKGYGAVNTVFLYMELIDRLDNSGIISMCKRKIKKIRHSSLYYLLKNYNTFTDKQKKWIDPTIAELWFSYGNKKAYLYSKVYLQKNAEQELKDKDDEDKSLQKLDTITKNDTVKKAIKKALSIKISISRDTLITTEQLIRTFKLQHKDSAIEKIEILKEVFKEYIDQSKIDNIIKTILIGKLGIALSGGGFRASLFHLGVFSRLAELDMLRHVEVISSVSGGSIMAMHYYIKLQELLQTTPNEKITKEHYIKIVKSMQNEFLFAIQSNIRMKAFLKGGNSSLTEKLGELYIESIYKLSVKNCPKNMDDLYINPQIEDKTTFENFNPHFNNIELKNKIPILIINSTCLNNGHNWRFTASGMGESPYMYDTTIDKNKIYEYKRYEELNTSISIGNAVASSSCVPGLFDPIEIKNNSYGNNEIIKLVDGGVYDNQGLASVIDEECSLILVSDASGQFKDEKDPSSCRLDIIPRINDALMDRGRDLTYSLVKNMKRNKQIDGLSILHLKQCFKEDKKVCDSFYTQNEKKIQEKLAKIRTDLDTFNDAESYALMNSGYHISTKWLKITKDQYWDKIYLNNPIQEKWRFKKIQDKIDNDFSWIDDILKISEKKFLKIGLFETGSVLCSSLLVGAGIIVLYILMHHFVETIFLIGFIMISLIIIGARDKKRLSKVLKLLLRPILKRIARFNLKCINNKYLESGEVL